MRKTIRDIEAKIGGEYTMEWGGENPTWFFHDWDHAKHDTYIANCTVEMEQIDFDRERRAQINGAREALKSGISLNNVVSAVASIMADFKERFNASLEDVWSDIFDGMMVVPSQ